VPVSRSLLKLIDEAIIPALLVFGAKLLGLVLANVVFRLDWTPAPYASFLPLMSYDSAASYFLANTLSNVIVLAVILAGFIWVLVRAHSFHSTHISPRLSVSLVSMQMTGLVADSWEIYHQAVIWLSYLWLSLLLFATQAFIGTTPWWLVAGGCLIGALFTWLFVVDVEREVELRRDA
jgi:hypothetical protein